MTGGFWVTPLICFSWRRGFAIWVAWLYWQFCLDFRKPPSWFDLKKGMVVELLTKDNHTIYGEIYSISSNLLKVICSTKNEVVLLTPKEIDTINVLRG